MFFFFFLPTRSTIQYTRIVIVDGVEPIIFRDMCSVFRRTRAGIRILRRNEPESRERVTYLIFVLRNSLETLPVDRRVWLKRKTKFELQIRGREGIFILTPYTTPIRRGKHCYYVLFFFHPPICVLRTRVYIELYDGKRNK